MKPKFSISFQKLFTFFKKNSHKMIYLILVLYFIYIIFFLYQYLYLPLAEKKAIDPNLIERKKETINQPLFEKVSKRLEEKTNPSSNINLNFPNPF